MSWYEHPGSYSKNHSADTGEEGKINFCQGIKPGPRDWESSMLSIRPLPQIKVYLPSLSYVLWFHDFSVPPYPTPLCPFSLTPHLSPPLSSPFPSLLSPPGIFFFHALSSVSVTVPCTTWDKCTRDWTMWKYTKMEDSVLVKKYTLNFCVLIQWSLTVVVAYGPQNLWL